MDRCAQTATPTPPEAAGQAKCQPPAALQRWMDAEGNRYILRHLAPSDAAALGRLWDQNLSARSRYNRFHGTRGRFTPARLAQLAHIDPAEACALVVTLLVPGGERLLAEARWVRTPGRPGQAELALSVADEWQAHGLGRQLMRALAANSQAQGLQTLSAQVLPCNAAMIALLQRAGFALSGHQQGEDCVEYGCTVQALVQRLKTPALTRLSRWLAAWQPRKTAARCAPRQLLGVAR